MVRSSAEAIRQVIDGEDFPPAKRLLGGITAEKSVLVPPGFKYSIATYIEHADLWHRIWMGRLRGAKRPSFIDDWRIPAAQEWKAIREKFLASLQDAYEFAAAIPFRHKVESNEVADHILLEIALHDAYHMGQIVLLKRAVRESKA